MEVTDGAVPRGGGRRSAAAARAPRRPRSHPRPRRGRRARRPSGRGGGLPGGLHDRVRDGRRSPDFVIIARTDARAVEGMDSAIERAHRYREAGADVLFVEAAESEDEISSVARRLSDVPLLFNWAEGGKTPPVDYATLAALGFKVVIFPIATLLGTTAWIRHALAEI